MNQANWFVGFPAQLDRSLQEIVSEVPPAVRAFDARDLHFTLAFLGRCTEEAARRGFHALADIQVPRFELVLAGMRAMGPPHRYSALAAIPGEGRAELEAWMSAHRGAVWLAADTVNQVDTRPALAHLTLARPQRKASEAERAAALDWALALPTQGCGVRLDRIALFTWAQDRSERLFEIVASRCAAEAKA